MIGDEIAPNLRAQIESFSNSPLFKSLQSAAGSKPAIISNEPFEAFGGVQPSVDWQQSIFRIEALLIDIKELLSHEQE